MELESIIAELKNSLECFINVFKWAEESVNLKTGQLKFSSLKSRKKKE